MIIDQLMSVRTILILRTHKYSYKRPLGSLVPDSISN